MQIGEDDLAAAQLLAFGGQRLLHLHDQFGALKYPVRSCDDLGAGGDVLLVGKAGARACHGLDRDPMSPRGQFPDRRGSEADAVFVGFDFLGNADQHGRLQLPHHLRIGTRLPRPRRSIIRNHHPGPRR